MAAPRVVAAHAEHALGELGPVGPTPRPGGTTSTPARGRRPRRDPLRGSPVRSPTTPRANSPPSAAVGWDRGTDRWAPWLTDQGPEPRRSWVASRCGNGASSGCRLLLKLAGAGDREDPTAAPRGGARPRDPGGDRSRRRAPRRQLRRSRSARGPASSGRPGRGRGLIASGSTRTRSALGPRPRGARRGPSSGQPTCATSASRALGTRPTTRRRSSPAIPEVPLSGR